MKEEKQIVWSLEKLSIEFKQGYSFNNTKDHYIGKVKFKNNEGDTFEFNLNEEQTQKYLDVVANDVVRSANELGNKLAQSLNK